MSIAALAARAIGRTGIQGSRGPSLLIALLLGGSYGVLPERLGAQEAEAQMAAEEPGAVAVDASGPCAEGRFREFDYWLGTWAVYDPEGERIGTNTISVVSEGCALLERWESIEGPTGMSLNHYDPARERWEQLWIGGGGLILRLAGGLEDGVMVLTATEPRETDRGTVVDRISWIPEDGAVRQLWEISDDDGESWQTTFEGIYRWENER